MVMSSPCLPGDISAESVMAAGQGDKLTAPGFNAADRELGEF